MKCSFWSLLSKHKIEIPMIQRDYAHGRDTEQACDTRKTLVRKVMEAALGTGPHTNLQYVFGNVNDENAFIPIDGQQRLTTLYLLHLYLINKVSRRLVGNSESCQAWCAQFQQTCLYGVKNILSRFCYKTRVTSNDFCRALVLHGCLPPTDAHKAISDWIADQPWFAPAWHRDPTVVGMMRTLDTVDTIFRDEECKITSSDPDAKALKSLMAREEKDFVVAFQWFDMQQHSLTDDLYLKMNARGLPLTPLENLKSSIEKRYKAKGTIKQSTTEEKSGEVLGEIAKKFSRNMDGAWLDAVWNCEQGQDNIVSVADGSLLVLLMRFCVFSAVVNGLASAKNGEDLKNTIEKRIIPIRGTERFIRFAVLERILEINPVAVLSDVSNWFDRFAQYRDLMLEGLVPYWESAPKKGEEMTWHSFLKKFKDGDPVWKDMAALFAALAYFEYGEKLPQGDERKSEYIKWMHFAWNLIENTGLDNLDGFSAFAKCIQDTSKQIGNMTFPGICAYLQQCEDANFSKNISKKTLLEQFSEEVVKAKLDPDRVSALERRPWFKGRIRIVLTVDGKIDYCLEDALSGLWDLENRKKWLYEMIRSREIEYEQNPSCWVAPIQVSSILNSDVHLKEFLYNQNYVVLIREKTTGYLDRNAKSLWLKERGIADWTKIQRIQTYGSGVYAYTTGNIQSAYRIDAKIQWWHDFAKFMLDNYPGSRPPFWTTYDRGCRLSWKVNDDDFALSQIGDTSFVQIKCGDAWIPDGDTASKEEKTMIDDAGKDREQFQRLIDYLLRKKNPGEVIACRGQDLERS